MIDMKGKLSRNTGQMSGQAAVCEDTTAVAHCCRPGLLRGLRGFLLVLLWTGYLLAGAAVFHTVEEPAATVRHALRVNVTQETNQTIVDLFEQLLDNLNVTMNVTKREHIMTKLAAYLKVMAEMDSDNTVKWNFMNSALFCMTVISTIGYGYLSPKTQLGRGLCIIYALIGIPLNIIVMASAGKVLTQGLTCGRRCLQRCMARLAPGRKVEPHQTDGSAASPNQLKYGCLEIEMARASRRDLANVRTVALDFDPNNRESTNGIDSIGCNRDDRAMSADARSPADAVSDHDVPFFGFVFLVLLYTCVFAMAMYVEEEDWTVLDCFYYIIITITTIGFGDLVAKTSFDDDDSRDLSYYLLSSLAIAIPVLGMIILSAGISIVVNQFGKKTKAIEEIICGSSETRR